MTILILIIPITMILLLLFLIYETGQIQKVTPTTFIKEETSYNAKYIKKDYLLTEIELKFYKQLKKITDELELTICPQVTLYEIINTKNFKDFNKIKSKSIDFVITEPNLKIKLCIELDDNTHCKNRRIQRDMFINNLFKDLNIKLLRIPVQNFYNTEDLREKIKESL